MRLPLCACFGAVIVSVCVSACLREGLWRGFTLRRWDAGRVTPASVSCADVLGPGAGAGASAPSSGSGGRRDAKARAPLLAARDKFVADVGGLVAYLCDPNEGAALDLQSLHTHGDKELQDCMRMLTIMTTMDVFTEVRVAGAPGKGVCMCALCC